MKLKDITRKKGTYAALRVLQPSCDNLYEHCKTANLPVTKSQFCERLHTTLIYSRKYCPKLFAEPGTLYEATFKNYELFDDGKTLVALLNAPGIVARHLKLMALHGASYDFPVFNPHVTLSYDFKGDMLNLPIIDFPILLGKEYVEDLNLDWE